MAFSFMRSTSHRPDVEHLEDEEDEQQQQMPAQWSGGVRAFSHLPKQKKPWSGGKHGLSLPPQAENQDYRMPRPSLDDLGAPNFGMPPEPVNKPYYVKPTENGREGPFMPPEPVNKPYYVKPGASGRQGPFRPPEPDNDVYKKPQIHRPEDDYDVYKKLQLHRPEDDYEVDVKPPNPLLDSLPPLEEDEDGDEDEMRPPARSGMVRAFSHLPERREEEDTADAETLQQSRNTDEQHNPDTDRGALTALPPYSAPASRFFEQRSPFGAPPADSKFSDLVYRGKGSPADEQDRRRGFFQNVAASPNARRTQSSPPAPANATPSSPQTLAQSSKPGAQAPAQGATPQSPAANGQTPRKQLTPEDQAEVFDKDGNERKPRGQLGIKGGTGFGQGKDGKPKTVCLYDGSEEKIKAVSGNGIADAIALQRAAQEYASNGAWVIDVSLPGWEDKLKAIQRATEGEGTAHNPNQGIDRIMVFDHQGSAPNPATGKSEISQEFGSSPDPATGKRTKNHLTPGSPAWKTITSSVKPKGDIVLTGCEVAKQGKDYTVDKDNPALIPEQDGQTYVEHMFHAADKARTPTIHAYDEDVWNRTHRGRLSLTLGRQHSRSTEGYQVEGPDRPAEKKPAEP